MTVPSSSAIACSGDGGSGPRAASTRYCIAFLPGITGLPNPTASIIRSFFVPATGMPAPTSGGPTTRKPSRKPPSGSRWGRRKGPVTGWGDGSAWWRRHFLDGTHFHVQEFGPRSSESHPRHQTDDEERLAADLVLTLGEIDDHSAPHPFCLIVTRLGEPAAQCEDQRHRVLRDRARIDA